MTMPAKEAAKVLRRYQSWRKGDIDQWEPDSNAGPDPRTITAAIDAAVAALEAVAGAEPVAWAYRFDIQKRHDDMHDHDEYSEVVYRTRRELSPDDPFGRRGYDFGDEADTTEIPLYTAPQPAACAKCGLAEMKAQRGGE